MTMEDLFQSSLTAFNGAMVGSDCIREEPSYEDDVCSEGGGLEIQAHNVLQSGLLLNEVTGSYRDDSLKLDELSSKQQQKTKGKRRNRLSIEIKDTSGKRVQLEKQLAAVHRAVVEPIQREITRLKTAGPYDETQISNPELEIVLMASFGSDFGSSRSSSSRSRSTSMDDEDKDSDRC